MTDGPDPAVDRLLGRDHRALDLNSCVLDLTFRVAGITELET